VPSLSRRAETRDGAHRSPRQGESRVCGEKREAKWGQEGMGGKVCEAGGKLVGNAEVVVGSRGQASMFWTGWRKMI